MAGLPVIDLSTRMIPEDHKMQEIETTTPAVRGELEPAWIADTQRKIYSMGLWPQKLPYTDVVDAIIKEIRA